MVTFRLKDLQAATKAIHDAEKRSRPSPTRAGSRSAQAGAQLAYSPLVGAENGRRRGVPGAVPQEQEGRGVNKQLSPAGRPVEQQGARELRARQTWPKQALR
jgi:phosphoglycerate transport regulatory protein PgtC